MPLAVESHLHLWYMLVLSSVTIYLILVQVLREFYFTVMEIYVVFSAFNGSRARTFRAPWVRCKLLNFFSFPLLLVHVH
jgi:hypothetical protein